jgi:hypothetical protein
MTDDEILARAAVIKEQRRAAATLEKMRQSARKDLAFLDSVHTFSVRVGDSTEHMIYMSGADIILFLLHKSGDPTCPALYEGGKPPCN